MIDALAYAKVNLGLRIGRIGPDGFHDVHGIFQSVDWADRLSLRVVSDADGEGDVIESWSGGEVVDGFANLAWRAVSAVREAVGDERRLHLRLDKRIPVAAGLGGGSADAAAALQMAVRLLRAPADLVGELAPILGSDVPFCVRGGSALVSGRGDIVEPLDPIHGFGLGLVVAPVELRTPDVYRRWDELGGPAGEVFPERALPPTLRGLAPFANDLYPAAASLAPQLDEWRGELAATWGRPVLMSGSGPTLMGFFVDTDEAAAAVDEAPPGVRAAAAAAPVRHGWRFEKTG